MSMISLFFPLLSSLPSAYVLRPTGVIIPWFQRRSGDIKNTEDKWAVAFIKPKLPKSESHGYLRLLNQSRQRVRQMRTCVS